MINQDKWVDSLPIKNIRLDNNDLIYVLLFLEYEAINNIFFVEKI